MALTPSPLGGLPGLNLGGSPEQALLGLTAALPGLTGGLGSTSLGLMMPAGGLTGGPLLGCRVTRRVQLGGVTVQAMKIVRYTDALPSALAFEIDAHELCHAIASLQPIADPCHTENNGFIRSSANQFAVR